MSWKKPVNNKIILEAWILNLTIHKLEEFLEGEVFDEIVESLSLKAQEESLNKL